MARLATPFLDELERFTKARMKLAADKSLEYSWQAMMDGYGGLSAEEWVTVTTERINAEVEQELPWPEEWE